MVFFSWCKLVFLEQKLQFGEFGKYNRYRYLCLKRQPKNTVEKLRIAKEVLEGPGVTTMEAQANEQYLRNAAANHQREVIHEVNGQRAQDATPPKPDSPEKASDQARIGEEGEAIQKPQ